MTKYELKAHSANAGQTPKATIFFDGSCPMCSREIAHYRRLRTADQLYWIDIASDVEKLADYGLDSDIVMSRFHVLDASGNWQTGAWGFAEMWSHLPYYRWLSSFLNAFHLLPSVDRGYRHFARWRLKRQCHSGVCGSIKN